MEHLMPAVPKSFLYKAIRQNKIKIDRKKPADLSVVLQAGNVVQIYLTDEQLKEFGYRAGNVQKQKAETGKESDECILHPEKCACEYAADNCICFCRQAIAFHDSFKTFV